MKTVINNWQFTDMADLANIIESAKLVIKYEPGAGEDHVVYVSTDAEEPTQFASAVLIKTVLTDGSFVFDLRLS